MFGKVISNLLCDGDDFWDDLVDIIVRKSIEHKKDIFSVCGLKGINKMEKALYKNGS